MWTQLNLSANLDPSCVYSVVSNNYLSFSWINAKAFRIKLFLYNLVTYFLFHILAYFLPLHLLFLVRNNQPSSQGFSLEGGRGAFKGKALGTRLRPNDAGALSLRVLLKFLLFFPRWQGGGDFVVCGTKQFFCGISIILISVLRYSLNLADAAFKHSGRY